MLKHWISWPLKRTSPNWGQVSKLRRTPWHRYLGPQRQEPVRHQAKSTLSDVTSAWGETVPNWAKVLSRLGWPNGSVTALLYGPRAPEPSDG